MKLKLKLHEQQFSPSWQDFSFLRIFPNCLPVKSSSSSLSSLGQGQALTGWDKIKMDCLKLEFSPRKLLVLVLTPAQIWGNWQILPIFRKILNLKISCRSETFSEALDKSTWPHLGITEAIRIFPDGEEELFILVVGYHFSITLREVFFGHYICIFMMMMMMIPANWQLDLFCLAVK